MSRVNDNKASNVQWNDHEPSFVEDEWQNIHSEGLTSSKDQSYNTEIELRETKSQSGLVEDEDDIPKWTTTFFGTNFKRFSQEWNQMKSRWQLKYGQTSSAYEPTIATKSRTNGDWALPIDETNDRILLPYNEYKSGFFNSIENSRSSESEWHDQDEKMKQFKRKRCLCISIITVVTCLVLAACITSALLIHVILAPTDKKVYVESRISATTTNQQYLEGMGDKSTKIFQDFEEQFCSAVQEKLNQTSKCKIDSLRNGSVIVIFFIYIQTENIKSDVKASIMSILSVKENEKSQLKFGTFVINPASFKAIETQTIAERSVPDDTIIWPADDNKETVNTKASSSSDILTTEKRTSSTVQPENIVTSPVIPTSSSTDKIESSTSSIIIHSKKSSTTHVVFATNEYTHTTPLKSSENTVELDSPAFEIFSTEINTKDKSFTMMEIFSTNEQMYVTSDQLVDSSDFQRMSTADVPDLKSTTEYPSTPLSENSAHGFTANTVSTKTEISMSHLIDESKAIPQTTSTSIYTKFTADITSSNEINTIVLSSTMMEIVSTNGQMSVTSDQLVDSSDFQRMSTADVPDLTSTTDYPSAPLSENSAHGSTSNTDSTYITMSHQIDESEKNTQATVVSTYTTSIADSASSTDFSRNDHSLTVMDIFSTNVQMYVTSDLMEAQSSLTADMMYDTLSSVSHMYITDSDKRSVIFSLSATPSISDGYGSSELFEDSLYSISTSYISPTDLVGSNLFEATDSSLETPSLDFAGSVTSNPLDYVSSTIEVSSITSSSSSSMEVSTTLPIPKPVVEATGVTVYQDDGNLTFTCTVDNYQNFTNIILSYDNLEIFNITDNHDDTEESTWSLAKTTLETTLTLVVTYTNSTCEDSNKYFRCLVHGAWGVVSDSAVSVVKVKPGIPKIALPIKFIENQDTNQDIYCSLDAGDPAAIVSWSVEFIDGQKIDPYDFSATITTKPDQPCSNITKSSIRRKFDLSWHNASLCCTATQDQITSSTCQKLYIIPADYCIGKVDGHYNHPYDDCYLFVQCGSNITYVNKCGEANKLCFDESTGTCGKAITTTRDPNFVDDPYSCEGKTNNPYIPVQNSCKNYSWCVHGIKHPGVCQGDTFFSGEPDHICTNLEENAYCNRNT